VERWATGETQPTNIPNPKSKKQLKKTRKENAPQRKTSLTCMLKEGKSGKWNIGSFDSAVF